jgi:hypothetical protein
MYHLDSSSEESLSDIDSILSDESTTSHQSNISDDSFSVNVFDDTTNTIGESANAFDGTTNTTGVSGIVFDDTTKKTGESCYSSFNTSQKCVTSLIFLLDSMECPDYAFRAIMDWAHESYAAGFDFNPKCKSRSGNLKWMFESIHNAKQMLPHLTKIHLPDPLPDCETMEVICYDFVPQLLSILQNKEMMSADNLVLDPNAPLARFQPQDGRLGEALSGSVYQKLYSDLVTNPSKQFLCPLIIYTDAAAVDSLFRFLVEPLVFTVAVLSQDARSKANAWRPLGYVQQLKSSLRSDEHNLSGDAKARNYHAQLSAMLETLRLAQSPKTSTLKNVEIYLFGKVVTVDILCPILFISADTPAADKLCGHYSSYNAGVK